MKRLSFLAVAIFMSVVAMAQSNFKEVEFYGVDFTKAKVIGASETPVDFKRAFSGINNLFISEPKKYDIERYFGKKATVNIDMLLKQNDDISTDNIKTNDSSYTLTEEQIASMVSSYNVTGKGLGLVFIVSKMDKGRNEAIVYVVFFDKETKKVIKSNAIPSRAAGFGLRNYWAGAIFNSMKTWANSSYSKGI